MTALSNADALLVGVPMIGLLLVVHFRLDELVGKPRKSRKAALPGRQFAEGADPVQPSREEGGWSRCDLPAVRRPRVQAERVRTEIE